MAELGARHKVLVFRRRLRRFALLAALAIAMAGCTGSSGTLPSVSGNEQGGKVPYAEGSMPAAMDAAKAHCSQFGKKAQMTQMSPAAEEVRRARPLEKRVRRDRSGRIPLRLWLFSTRATASIRAAITFY
ncbi:MAG: hypothetical protein E6G96_12650 [Alphaproteobacteria bacterium]|nr:MAG: hypothetical protein E6G96_12650 [Alphaproteobacteria bacterium]